MDKNSHREPLQVLYEDNHLIAVFKPSNLLVQGDSTGAPNLLDVTRTWLKDKYQKKGRAFVGLLHRLDKPVSGVVLFAKTSKGASRIGEQMRRHEIKKIYEAWVHGTPDKNEGELIHYLESSEEKVLAFNETAPNRKYAKLSYMIKGRSGEFSRLEVNLLTGRKHQIRVQLSAIGHPIVGDQKYGSPITLPSAGIKLFARQIDFSHPVRGERIQVIAPQKFEFIQ